MSTVENGLIDQARTHVQQSNELARHQKEADQIGRQLFADCVETVDLYGTRVNTIQGFDRWVALGMATPAALLFRTSPTELLDRTDLARTIDSDGTPLQIKLSTATPPRKSPDISIWLQGINYRLVLNRYKGYGEIYLNNPGMNEPTQRQGRANILEVTNFKEAVESMRDFVKAPTVPLPDDVLRYSQMNDEILKEELKKAQRWSGINLRANQLECLGLVTSFVLSAGSGNPELTFGSAGLLIVGTITHGKVGVNLERRARIIRDEIASRH